MFSDGVGPNILPCWGGGRHVQAMVSPQDFDYFFSSMRWIRAISLWAALSMVPIPKNPSGPTTGSDSWEKELCWGSSWSCLGWAHPGGHQPLQRCQKTL